jgi:hypothetical protein
MLSVASIAQTKYFIAKRLLKAGQIIELKINANSHGYLRI